MEQSRIASEIVSAICAKHGVSVDTVVARRSQGSLRTARGVSEIRAECARALLRVEHLTTKQIAQATGFKDWQGLRRPANTPDLQALLADKLRREDRRRRTTTTCALEPSSTSTKQTSPSEDTHAA